jgi:hypothetical protein
VLVAQDPLDFRGPQRLPRWFSRMAMNSISGVMMPWRA